MCDLDNDPSDDESQVIKHWKLWSWRCERCKVWEMTHHEQTELWSSHPPLTAARCYMSLGWAWLTVSLQRGKTMVLYKDNHSEKEKKISWRQEAGRALRGRTTDEWRGKVQTRLIFIFQQRIRNSNDAHKSLEYGQGSVVKGQTVDSCCLLGGGPGTKRCFQRCESLIALAKCVIRWSVRHRSRGGTESCCVGDTKWPSCAKYCDNRTRRDIPMFTVRNVDFNDGPKTAFVRMNDLQPSGPSEMYVQPIW